MSLNMPNAVLKPGKTVKRDRGVLVICGTIFAYWDPKDFCPLGESLEFERIDDGKIIISLACQQSGVLPFDFKSQTPEKGVLYPTMNSSRYHVIVGGQILRPGCKQEITWNGLVKVIERGFIKRTCHLYTNDDENEIYIGVTKALPKIMACFG